MIPRKTKASKPLCSCQGPHRFDYKDCPLNAVLPALKRVRQEVASIVYWSTKHVEHHVLASAKTALAFVEVAIATIEDGKNA